MPLFSPKLLRRLIPKCLSARARHSLHTLPITQLQSDTANTENQYLPVYLPGTEWAEDYAVGGHHPVRLGHFFNERYRVLRKLGSGRYATVWLAKDYRLRPLYNYLPNLTGDRTKQYTALKFARAYDISTATNGVKLLHSSQEGQFPLCVPKLIDSFQVSGPNGVHVVLVMEPLGTTIEEYINDMRFEDRRQQGRFHDAVLLRDLSRQLVSAMSFIHSKGIVHRGIPILWLF